MVTVFISHAGPDSTVAGRLAEDLRNAGHDTRIDLQALSLGDDSIAFMNEGIAGADFVIILHSAKTPTALWQKLEVNAAIWNENAQAGGKCIVLRLDDTPIPPLLGPKLYGKLDPTDPAAYRRLLEDLCQKVLPTQRVSSIVAEAFKAESGNPFRRVRAEYFEDQPDLLARTFAPPDALKMGALEDPKPCFLEGSRGTGKSMLLLSLRARNFSRRVRQGAKPHRIFGFYLKLSRGAVCNVGLFSDPSIDPVELLAKGTAAQIADIAAQELVVCLTESFLSELAYCIRESLLECDARTERGFAESTHRALFGSETERCATIEELLEKQSDTHRDVASYIRRRFIYNESPSVPVAAFDIESLKRVFDLARKHFPPLQDSMFVALLDEYENLFPYQQRVINGFIKFAAPEFSVKVAKKLGAKEVSGTPSGQELQETHDYSRIPLVYDVEDSGALRAYHELLKHMIGNLLRSQRLPVVEPQTLLPADNSNEVNEPDMLSRVAELAKLSPADLGVLEESKRKEKITYYKEAAVYRVLYGTKGKRAPKRFSGFADLAFLSSGVIRYFQELLSVGYHLTYGSEVVPNTHVVLPPERQSQAAHLVSEHNLTTLGRNVETHGESLKYFILDLGDCLRHKLLRHTSEPEAARITIEDPEMLSYPELSSLKRLLEIGVREGVFQTREGRPAFRAKHPSDPEAVEFNICRIFAPVLEVSPRLRWRTRIKARTLMGLVNPEQRVKTLRQMKLELVRGGRADYDRHQPGSLFEE